MWFMSVDGRSPSVFVVAERAVAEMKENDEDEQARDTINKDWSKDQWISGVLERAIGIVARSAEKGQQKFTVRQCRPDSARYAVWEDRSISKFYKDNSDVMSTQDGWEYFPMRNIDVKVDDDGEAIHLQGSQRLDSISLLKIQKENAAMDKKVCICFEGDGHNIDGGKKKSGMFLYEKMFHAAALCHDVNPGVPAILITSVLWTHDQTKFKSFLEWSVQFLREHVLLVEQLLQYINDKETSSIHQTLQGIDEDDKVKHEFDFYCWINAKREGDDVVHSDVKDNFNLLQTKTQQHGNELEAALAWRNAAYSPTDDWVAAKKNGFKDLAKQIQDGSGLLQNKFYAKVITRNEKGIPVVIFAVPRVKRDDVDGVAKDNAYACSGMWYPMHVARYVAQHGDRQIDNFLISANNKDNVQFEQGFSAIRKTDAVRLVLTKDEFDAKHKEQLSGHVLFTLPWLWMNIAFLCKLKSTLTYTVVKKAQNTLQMYTVFTRKHSTEIHSRDTVQNAMEMFPNASTSLFSHLCKEQTVRVSLDADLQEFLQQKCGWTNATSASSPAVFFSMVGARNLITAHTLAKQLRPTTALNAKVEDVKAAFPLAAQVEIEYALECLCRHYYFVQDKTIERDGLMKKSEFEKYKRKHEKELREAKQSAQSVKPAKAKEGVQRPNAPQPHAVVADAHEEVQPEAGMPLQPPRVPQPNVEKPGEDELWQDDVNEEGVKIGFTAPVGCKVADIKAQNEVTKEYLQQGRVAYLQKGEYWKETNEGRVKMDSWYIGVVHGQVTKNGPQNGFFVIKYPRIPNARQQVVNLLLEDYGCQNKWVLLLKDEN